MNENFWERFPPIPGFDCLKMKHDIQAKIHEETKHMNQEQRLEYYRAGARKLRRRGRLAPKRGEPTVVREDPATNNVKSRKKG